MKKKKNNKKASSKKTKIISKKKLFKKKTFRKKISRKNKSLKNIESAHRQWWHAYYPASFVNFPDARLESFYWIQLYKLASATHPGKPVIDLLGPWFKPTAWPLLWMNLNVQLTYFTMGVTNHTALEDNLYQLSCFL